MIQGMVPPRTQGSWDRPRVCHAPGQDEGVTDDEGMSQDDWRFIKNVLRDALNWITGPDIEPTPTIPTNKLKNPVKQGARVRYRIP